MKRATASLLLLLIAVPPCPFADPPKPATDSTSTAVESVGEPTSVHSPPAALPPPPELEAPIRRTMRALLAEVESSWWDSSAPISDSQSYQDLVSFGPNAITKIQPHLVDATGLPIGLYCAVAASAFAEITGIHPLTPLSTKCGEPRPMPSQYLAAWRQAQAEYLTGGVDERAERLRATLLRSPPSDDAKVQTELRLFSATFGVFALPALISLAVQDHHALAFTAFLRIVHPHEQRHRTTRTGDPAPGTPRAQIVQWWTAARPNYAAVPELQSAIDAATAQTPPISPP